MRTSKTGAAFYEIVTAFELDGQTPITSLTSSDFTIATYKNGVSEVISYVVSEIGSGHYLLALSGGFDTSGYRMITTLILATGILQRTDVQVSIKDVDDVYSAVSDGVTSGINTVTFTVQDTINSNASVPNTKIKIYNSSQSAIISHGTTNVNGLVSINLDPGTYIAKTFVTGYLGANTSVVVANQSSQSQTLSVQSRFVEAPAPSSPVVCRLFIDFIDLSGSPEVGKQVTVTVPLADTPGGVISRSTKTYLSNAAGRLQFDAVQDTSITVTIVGAGITRTVLVPVQDTKDLSDLMDISSITASGAGSGLFAVVV